MHSRKIQIFQIFAISTLPGKQDFPPQSLKQHFFSPIQSASVEHSSGRPQSELVLIIFGQTPSFLSFRHTGLKQKNRINFFLLFQKHAFIFKMWFFFKMSFHFQNVKGFVSVVFPFTEKHNCKQKSVHSLQIALLMRL